MPVSGRIILKPRRARPFFARHPWVFDTSIERIEGDPPAGAEVVVVSSEDKFVARGLYNPAARSGCGSTAGTTDRSTRRSGPSPRIGHPAPAVVLGLESGGQSAYRLVFSEGDGLSGLTVDRYDRLAGRAVHQPGALTSAAT